MKSHASLPLLLAALLLPARSALPQAGTADPVHTELLRSVDSMAGQLGSVNREIWEYAELGLQERKSAARLSGLLEEAGFRVRRGVSGMPTSFVAEYGSGRPLIGMLAEYDALPDLSQETAGERRPAPGRENGHGCGHSAFGTAVVGAALALRRAMESGGLKGTLRVYGTPAEETVIGKVYMTLDGQFKDLDACLHWHPGARNSVTYGSSKALISAKFTFTGLAAHAGGSPHRGRSALDAVELMNVGANYLREHVKETSRIHYVVTQGGGQPNVVPSQAQVWYYVRSNTHEDVEFLFDWLRDVADGAAKMTRTKVQVQIDTDCHELIPNLPISRLLQTNLERVGAPKFNAAEHELARRLQDDLRREPGFSETVALREDVDRLPEAPKPAEGGSTDVGDVSWHVPTSGFTAVCFAAGSPGHSWQNVAAVGSSIGNRGLVAAAKVLALTGADLLRSPALLAEARGDFETRMKGRRYTTRIPKGQKAPASIR